MLRRSRTLLAAAVVGAVLGLGAGPASAVEIVVVKPPPGLDPVEALCKKEVAAGDLLCLLVKVFVGNPTT